MHVPLVSAGTQGPRGAERPVPVIVCVRCGYEESEGVWYAAVEGDRGVPLVRHALPERPPPDRLDFPVYTRAGAAASMTGHGWNVDGVGATRRRPPVRFEGLRCQAGWAAVGRTEDVQITIAARHVAPEAVDRRRL